jgi:hypothetical protein
VNLESCSLPSKVGQFGMNWVSNLAEKSKYKCCLNSRKTGHFIKDCPKLRENDDSMQVASEDDYEW